MYCYIFTNYKRKYYVKLTFYVLKKGYLIMAPFPRSLQKTQGKKVNDRNDAYYILE